jgi:hypothetical protein
MMMGNDQYKIRWYEWPLGVLMILYLLVFRTVAAVLLCLRHPSYIAHMLLGR